MQPNTNPFTSPAAPGGGDPAPRPRDLAGCLVAYSPRIFTPAGAPGNTEGVGGAPPRDRVTTDLIILETPNGPIMFGGSPEYEAKPTPHTHRVAGPARFSGAWVSNSNIVKALAPGGQPLVGQMVLGRIERSEIGNRPFNIVDVAGTPDMDKAIYLWSQIQMGALPYNEPVPLNGVAPAPANSVQYGAPAAPPPMPPAQHPLQQYAPQIAPNSFPPPATPPAQAPVDPAYAAWLAAQQQSAPVAPPPAPPAPPTTPMPPGWTPQAWAQLSQAQQQQVWASVNPASPTPPPW